MNKDVCELCGSTEGIIWRHGDGGCGTSIRYGANLNVCKHCNGTQEAENEWRKRMNENRQAVLKQLERNMRTGENMADFCLDYYFKQGFLNIEEYEEYLGFKIPTIFRIRLENLHCDVCHAHIKPIPQLEEPPEYTHKKEEQEEYRRLYKQWKTKYQSLWRGYKYDGPPPEKAPELEGPPCPKYSNWKPNRTAEERRQEEQEREAWYKESEKHYSSPAYKAYSERYMAWHNTKELRHYCSEECFEHDKGRHYVQGLLS